MPSSPLSLTRCREGNASFVDFVGFIGGGRDSLRYYRLGVHTGRIHSTGNPGAKTPNSGPRGRDVLAAEVGSGQAAGVGGWLRAGGGS